MSHLLSISLIVIALHAAATFGVRINILENYIQSDEGVVTPFGGRFVVNPLHFTDEHKVQPHDSFDCHDLDANDEYKLNNALLQIRKDMTRISDPSFRTGEELKAFQSRVVDILEGAVRKLSQPNNGFKFKYLTGSDLEYVQGWDRLASAIAHYHENASLNVQIDFFLKRLDTKHGYLLNPKNYVAQYHATYIFLNNVNNALQTGFAEDDIDSFHLDFVKSCGVGYFNPDGFQWVFLQSTLLEDPFLFWMELAVSIACHPAIQSIKFTPEQTRQLGFSELITMTVKIISRLMANGPSSGLMLDQQVKVPPILMPIFEDKDGGDMPELYSSLRSFLKQTFPQETLLDSIGCEIGRR